MNKLPFKYGALLLLLAAGQLDAAEISTNGSGGGPFSDPASWHGKKVPGPGDDVIIQKYDVLAFDRNDDGKISFRKLLIDPKGMFTFKSGSGKSICCVAEAIESYGYIKIDGTKSAGDFFELRLVGDKAEQRRIKLIKGSGLLLYGRANLPAGRCNVALTSAKLKEDLLGIVDGDGDGKISIDWQRAYINDVKLIVKSIDNTGAKPNERINVIENQFTGQGRLLVKSCDTPVIVRNTFEYKADKPLDEPAIHVSFCPLADIKGNTVRGGFSAGIAIASQSDSALVGNTVENCTAGIVGGSVPNAIIKQCTVRGCQTGIKLDTASGVLEATTVEGAGTGLHQHAANLQLTNFQVKDVKAKGVAALVETGGTLTLLNCNIQPGQIKMGPPPAKPGPAPVTCLQYVVVAVKGAPAGSLVEMETAGLAAEVLDPNVRNTPARIVGGLTPLPRSQGSLMVKSWSIDDKGKPLPAPEYTVKILGPAPKEGAVRPVLHTITFRPQETALRTTLDDPTPTLEVILK